MKFKHFTKASSEESGREVVKWRVGKVESTKQKGAIHEHVRGQRFRTRRGALFYPNIGLG